MPHYRVLPKIHVERDVVVLTIGSNFVELTIEQANELAAQLEDAADELEEEDEREEEDDREEEKDDDE